MQGIVPLESLGEQFGRHASTDPSDLGSFLLAILSVESGVPYCTSTFVSTGPCFSAYGTVIETLGAYGLSVWVYWRYAYAPMIPGHLAYKSLLWVFWRTKGENTVIY
jgi:hypothetical protein